MTHFYSPSTRGFYNDSLHSIIPADAVSISGERYAELFAAQAQGLDIQPGADGAPVAVERTISHEQAMQLLRSRCDALLKASEHTQLQDFPGDETQRAAWAAYRSKLRDLREATDDPTSVIWPEPPTT